MSASAAFGAAPAPDGLDGAYTEHESQPQPPRTFRLKERSALDFTGPAPAMKWLVEGSIPLGVPVLVAAMGDTGKSYMVLQLCLRLTLPPVGNLDFNTPIFGGRLATRGTAIFVTSEDDRDEVHRRLEALDPNERRAEHADKLKIIALPSEDDGPVQFFVRDSFGGGPVVTAEWEQFCQECEELKGDLKLIGLDPLAAFAALSLDNDSTDAQFVATQLGRLAARTGATVLVCHHMRKGKDGKSPETAAEARERIRGSSGIVDGARCAYARRLQRRMAGRPARPWKCPTRLTGWSRARS